LGQAQETIGNDRDELGKQLETIWKLIGRPRITIRTSSGNNERDRGELGKQWKQFGVQSGGQELPLGQAQETMGNDREELGKQFGI
jgi:hypothetical protein